MKTQNKLWFDDQLFHFWCQFTQPQLAKFFSATLIFLLSMKLCTNSTIQKQSQLLQRFWGYFLFLHQNNEKWLKEQFFFYTEIQNHKQLSGSAWLLK